MQLSFYGNQSSAASSGRSKDASRSEGSDGPGDNGSSEGPRRASLGKGLPAMPSKSSALKALALRGWSTAEGNPGRIRRSTRRHPGCRIPSRALNKGFEGPVAKTAVPFKKLLPLKGATVSVIAKKNRKDSSSESSESSENDSNEMNNLPDIFKVTSQLQKLPAGALKNGTMKADKSSDDFDSYTSSEEEDDVAKNLSASAPKKKVESDDSSSYGSESEEDEGLPDGGLSSLLGLPTNYAGLDNFFTGYRSDLIICNDPGQCLCKVSAVLFL
ncbi:hypothetical protein Nepgr_013762 [Nepenthes gracilis]|uniref:Uncharacterized protein n=1 Tax=Nepenthes gracilis TaxID=150966 RepID=A0AAD3SKB4_NEPGR|nr:hypothetical protein Nepgr_013762 [Nepenthes gracilis]